jgi:hypothetical protein
LKGRNAAHAQSIASERTSTVRLGWIVTASIAKKAAAIAASVAARPSMLSSRLNAFVIPISQTSAIAIPRTSLETIWTFRPVERTTAAAEIWPASFAIGGRWKTSSASPNTNRIEHPARIPSSSWCEPGTAPTRSAPSVPRANPAKIPIPPRCGVGSVFQRSARGGETCRRAAGERSNKASTTAVAGKAIREAAALTRRRLARFG